MTTDDAIVAFYRGGPDVRGRTLDEILAWDDDRLEEVHDYIQWLFPTTKESAFNPDAPTLGRETIAAFTSDPALRARLREALARLLRFYGFELQERASAPVVVRGARWLDRREEWLVPGDHNLLRITRILDSLSTLGLGAHARAFLDALEALDAGDRRAIGPRTFAFWREAVRSS